MVQEHLLTSKARKHILLKIQHLSLKPDQLITELAVAIELGMSRTPVKEAFTGLVKDNLMKRIPRKGYVLIDVPAPIKQNIYTMIGVLDALAARSFLEYINETDIATMITLTEKMDTAISKKSFQLYYSLQEQFHDVYVTQCNNPILIEHLKNLINGPIHMTYFTEDQNLFYDLLLESNHQHKQIVDLFIAGDPDALEKYIRHTHWYASYQHLL